MPEIRIAIIDDHALVRAGITRLLERSPRFTVVGAAADAAEGMKLLRRTEPDLLLLDLSLPDQDGLTALPKLRSASPSTKVLILSMYDEPEYVEAAMTRGACGLISKAASPEVLYAAIERALTGELPPPETRLTPREREILRLVKDGKEDGEIAALLQISEKTVANHCERLMDKLGVHTRAGLIAHAKRIELASPD